MACDAVTMGIGVLFGPVDDVISHGETACHDLIFSKEEAISSLVEAIRAHLEEKLSEGNAFKIYMAFEKRDGVNGDEYKEGFDGEEKT